MIACDMDGVVANFTLGYTTAYHSFDHNAPLVKNYLEAKSWDYREWYYPEGYSEEVNEQAWQHIFSSPDFWAELHPLFPDHMPFLRGMHRGNVVFLTRRDGINPWGQTVQFLHKWGIHEPLVLRVQSGEEKDLLCKDMGVQVLIDDAPKNIELARDAGLTVVKMCWPYNAHIKTTYAAHNLYDALTTAMRVQPCNR